ncbi:MAG: RlmE family RNA methyltransferase [Pseudomonadaceae bacterium]|nr:RlmE family RNA methyltransferase [Pseudomonadaceae bacterium]
MAKRTKSSQRWLERQRKDTFAKKAASDGLGSRAHFKLEEIDARFKLIRPGMRILELGAAPGGWSRYAAERLNDGMIVAVDPRPITAPGNVVLLEGEYGNDDMDTRITEALDGRQVDLVLSDMAPNISGIRVRDQAEAMNLADLAVDAAGRWLKPGGSMVVKMFHGDGFDAWVADTRKLFGRLAMMKPKSSRSESREVFAVGIEYSSLTSHEGVV